MVKGYMMDAEAKTTSRALGKELNISPKKAYEVCNAIRGMTVEKATQYLQDVIALKRPVPFRRYNDEVAHKKGRGFGPGRFPVKVASEIMKVLEDAKQNAEYKGWDSDNMRIKHIAASRGRILEGRMPRAHGRSTEWNEQTTTIEIILELREKE